MFIPIEVVTNMKHVFLIMTIAVSLPASLQAGEVYRWTDESGNTHFSEDPPQGVDAEPVDIQTRSPEAPAGNQSAPESTPEQEDSDQNGDEGEEEASTQEERDQEAVDRVRQRNCERAKEALKTLEENARVQVEEDGERRYLSPEEKEAERERYEKARDENCD